ncbi:zinc finger protein 501-like isoform X3 [Cimex lectularius]|nr:zinc finger protein 501-like isoform X3 [Cimex lectularius]
MDNKYVNSKAADKKIPMVILYSDMQTEVEDDLISVIYFCRKCPYRANYVAELKAHINKKHRTPEINESFIVYPCNDCSFSATNPNELRAHLLIHSEDNVCIDCGFRTSDKNELCNHVFNEHCYNCMECLFTCDSDVSLRSHISKFHFAKVYSCSECSFTVLEEKEFMKHVSIHFAWLNNLSKNDILKHSENNYTSVKLVELEKYRKSHLKKPYSCVECDFTCLKEPELRYHIKKHITTFYCKKCPYFSTNEFTYQEHRRTHIRHKCPECVEVFKEFYDLQVHISLHNIVEKDYCCVECGHEFRNNSALKNHLLSHSDVKYNCSKCGFSTKYKNNYDLHVRNNCKSKTKSDKSYSKCYVKKKRQVSIGKLDSNFKSTVVEGFKCNKCDLLFDNMDALKMHTKNKHLTDAICKICGLQCTNKGAMAAHVKYKHSNIKKINQDLMQRKTT